MRIDFITPKRINAKQTPRVTLLKQGKLSFNKSLRKKLDITIQDYYKIGIDLDKPTDKSIYLQKCLKNDPAARKIHTSGPQVLLTITFALRQLGIDYINNKYEADFEEVIEKGEKLIKITFTPK